MDAKDAFLVRTNKCWFKVPDQRPGKAGLLFDVVRCEFCCIQHILSLVGDLSRDARVIQRRVGLGKGRGDHGGKQPPVTKNASTSPPSSHIPSRRLMLASLMLASLMLASLMLASLMVASLMLAKVSQQMVASSLIWLLGVMRLLAWLLLGPGLMMLAMMRPTMMVPTMMRPTMLLVKPGWLVNAAGQGWSSLASRWVGHHLLDGMAAIPHGGRTAHGNRPVMLRHHMMSRAMTCWWRRTTLGRPHLTFSQQAGPLCA